MIEKISLIVLIISIFLLVAIFIKKSPELVQIKKDVSVKEKEKFFLKIWKEISNIPFVKNFSWNSYLQKLFSKTRIILLKIEKKIGDYLHSLRKKSQMKK